MENPGKTETLSKLSRKELQVLAKEYGVKANLKTEEIIELISRKVEDGYASSSLATPCPSNPVSPVQSGSITKPRSQRSTRYSRAPSSAKAPASSARKRISPNIQSKVAEEIRAADECETDPAIVEGKLEFSESVNVSSEVKHDSPISKEILGEIELTSESRPGDEMCSSGRKVRKPQNSDCPHSILAREVSTTKIAGECADDNPCDAPKVSPKSAEQMQSILDENQECMKHDCGNYVPESEAILSNERGNSRSSRKSRASLQAEELSDHPDATQDVTYDQFPVPSQRLSCASVSPLHDPSAPCEQSPLRSAKKARISLHGSTGSPRESAAACDLSSQDALPALQSEPPTSCAQPSIEADSCAAAPPPRRSSRSSSAAAQPSSAQRPVAAPSSRTAAQPRRSAAAAPQSKAGAGGTGEGRAQPQAKRAPPPDFDRMHRLAFARMPSIKDKPPAAPRSNPPPPPPPPASAARVRVSAARTAAAAPPSTAPTKRARAADLSGPAPSAPLPKRPRTSVAVAPTPAAEPRAPRASTAASVAASAAPAAGVAALGVRDRERTGYRPPAPFVVMKSTKHLTAAAPFNFSQPRPKTAHADPAAPSAAGGVENCAPAPAGRVGGAGARASLVLDRVAIKVPSATQLRRSLTAPAGGRPGSASAPARRARA